MARQTGNEGGRDPKVYFRADPARLEILDQLADTQGWSRSRILRSSLDLFLETQSESLGEIESLLEQARQEKERGKDVEKILGFPGRVRHHLEDRFKEQWSPGALLDSSRSYYREAEILEKAAQAHPDVQSIQPGEFVQAVDDELEKAVQAMQITDWDERHENEYQKFDGVEQGRLDRKLALSLTRTAMQKDIELEAIRQNSSVDVRVSVSHFPEDASDDDLPADVTLEDVVEVARRLVDGGVDPEEIEIDPLEFDPFGWTSQEIPSIAANSPQSGGEPEPPSLVAVDGGDHFAVQSFADPPSDQDEDAQDDDQEDDRLAEVIEAAAERLEAAELFTSQGRTADWHQKKRAEKRRNAEDRIADWFEADRDTWKTRAMEGTQLTPDRLIELADEYNAEMRAALHGERDGAPEAIVDDNGGVAIE